MSPQVRFYILPDEDQQMRNVFACRLAERAWKSGVRTHISLRDESDMAMMDSLLWSFREESFLPHAKAGGNTQDHAQSDVPVIIGCGMDRPLNHNGLLINLGDTIPDNIRSFSRIAEIVVQVDDVLAAARTRYRLYTKKMCNPKVSALEKRYDNESR